MFTSGKKSVWLGQSLRQYMESERNVLFGRTGSCWFLTCAKNLSLFNTYEVLDSREYPGTVL